jgi:hypothetical protein
MKYETPELTALMPAINAIQAIKGFPVDPQDAPRELSEHAGGAYQDWE